MSIEFESRPTTEEIENKRITYELLTYVFGYIPEPDETMEIERIAEDLEETEDTIMATLEELRSDKMLDFTYADGVVTITAKDEEFLELYGVYKILRR